MTLAERIAARKVGPIGLPCCGGLYAHRATCTRHRHTFDGPRDCDVCRATPRVPTPVQSPFTRRALRGELPAKGLR